MESREQNKRYIGDGVYACQEDGMLKLTTEYGDDIATNTIYLGYDEINALCEYLQVERKPAANQ